MNQKEIANKLLEVSGAQIPHFSRYGGTRVKQLLSLGGFGGNSLLDLLGAFDVPSRLFLLNKKNQIIVKNLLGISGKLEEMS